MVEEIGNIYKVKDGKAVIIAPVNPYLVEKQKIKSYSCSSFSSCSNGDCYDRFCSSNHNL